MTTAVQVRAQVMSALAKHPGWATLTILGGLFAAKEYETAVGQKVASARLDACPGGNFWLCGEYDSEGRNVLESTFITLSGSPTDEEVANAAASFAEQVDHVVSQTYAARLRQLSRG